MSLMFEWDGSKARSNLRKHAVRFEEAATVFAGPLARIFPDPDHSAVERRELLVGHSTAGSLLVVSFVERSEGVVRIISARKATPREQRDYEENVKS